VAKVALITGASSGIGAGLALALAQAGYDLLLTARRTEPLWALARQLPATVKVHGFSADLANPQGVPALLEQVQARGWPVDLLVNNAGVGQFGPFATADESALLAMLQLNILTPTQLTRSLLPGMLARGQGQILQVASTAAFFPGPLMASYYASKAYLLRFSLALREELRETPIRVSCLCPGPTRTPFLARAGTGDAPLKENPGAVEVSVVVAAALRGLERNQAIILPGRVSRWAVTLGSWLPVSWQARWVHRLQARRLES
jgi:short-subunit dehydrogenase